MYPVGSRGKERLEFYYPAEGNVTAAWFRKNLFHCKEQPGCSLGATYLTEREAEVVAFSKCSSVFLDSI